MSWCGWAGDPVAWGSGVTKEEAGLAWKQMANNFDTKTSSQNSSLAKKHGKHVLQAVRIVLSLPPAREILIL
ncbi:MAG: hypothetical protein C0490_00110 [Marivirga sp.]|nr:hypothetical protein [Marivirga sp.]